MSQNIEISLDWFRADNLKPLRIWGYPSSVDSRIFEAEYYDRQLMKNVEPNIKDAFDRFRSVLQTNHLNDNKIVIECEIKDNPHATVFMGWKDNHITIGNGVHAYDNQLPKDISHISFDEQPAIHE